MSEVIDWERQGPSYAWSRDKEGPAYPGLNTTAVKRGRSLATWYGGVKAMDPDAARSYGEAVLEAVRSLQRTENLRAGTSLPAPYRGRNSYEIGKAILRRIQGQQEGRLAACPSAMRRARDDKTWRKMYAEAMADKRKRYAETITEERMAA
jgi:hypothetical protein